MHKNIRLISAGGMIILALAVIGYGGCIVPTAPQASTVTVAVPSTVTNSVTSTVTTGIPQVVPYTVTATLQPPPLTVTAITTSSIPVTTTSTVPVTVTSVLPTTVTYTPPYTQPPSGQAYSISLVPQSAFNQAGTYQSLVATVYDQAGNPLPNQVLNWSILSGPGDFMSAQPVTDAYGRAQAVVISPYNGTTAIEVALSANASISAIAYQTWVVGTATRILFLTLDSSSAPVGTEQLLVANLTDQGGTPIYGVSLEWDIVSGPGTIIAAQSVTDLNGQAQAVVTSSVRGTTVVQVDMADNPAVFATASLTWTQITASMLTLSPQTASNSVATNRTLTATVVDQNGNRSVGVAITWTIVSGPGNFVSTQAVTNGVGQAQAVVTSSIAGTTIIRAALATNASVSSTARVTWSGVTTTQLTLSPTVASNRTGTNRTLTATVVDQLGNPISGITITWTIQSGPGSFVTMQTVTNASGRAQAVLTSSTAGTTAVRAAVSGNPSISDTATVTWTRSED